MELAALSRCWIYSLLTKREGDLRVMKLQETHQPRPIRFLDLWEISGFRMKVYGIAYRRDLPRSKFIKAARKIAEHRLKESASKTNHYGTGYIGIHDGRGAAFVFIDWWADENELHHHVYVFPADKSDEIQYVTPTGLTACVWDMRVMSFERDAWFDNVIANPVGPDLEAYINARLNEDA